MYMYIVHILVHVYENENELRYCNGSLVYVREINRPAWLGGCPFVSPEVLFV